MFTRNRNQWIIGIIFLLTLAVQGIDPAVSQQTPQQDAEKRKAVERLFEQMQKATEAQKQPGAKPAPEAAQPPAPPIPSVVRRASTSSGQVQLSYDNADLYEFINQIADTLGITPIVIDPEVKGTVTIHSSAPMSTDDVFPLFNLILKNNNAALVKQGSIYQIVPISAGVKKGLEIIEHLPPAPPEKPDTGGDDQKTVPAPPGTQQKPANPESAAPSSAAPAPASPQAQPRTQKTPPSQAPATSAPAPAAQAEAPKGGRLSTHVIRVEFVPVRDLIDPLKLFMTDGGVIMPYERLNMLIVTDYADSVAKILDIIHLLDDSYLNPDLIELVKITNNNSNDVVEDLRKIFGSGTKDSATGIYFVSLDRMNSILVMANSKRALEEIKRWIAQLDATTGRSIQTFVYTVENGTASNIAMILSALFGGEGTTSTSGSGGTGGAGGGYVSGGRGYQSGMTGGGGGVATPFGNTGGSTFGGGSTSYGGYGGTGFGGGGYGSYGSSGFGGGYGGSGGYGGYGSFGGGFLGGGQQLGPRLGGGPGITATILRGGAFSGLQDAVRIVVDEINNTLIVQSTAADYAYISETIKKLDVLPRQAIIDARIFEVDLTDDLSFGVSATLQGRTSGQHLTTGAIDATTGALSASTFAFVGSSREILMNLNALRAKTKVRVLEAPSVLALDGTEAHIVVGGEVPYPGGSFIGAAGGATTSVGYRDTGVQLIVMPRISASGTVTLAIAQEISTPGAPNALGPTFNKTSVSTTLAVKDGETVAIAGLIRDNHSSSRSGVPLFSDIPLLGALFGVSSRNVLRTEVLIMITPHVIRTPEKFQEMTRDLKDALRHVGKFADQKAQEIKEDIQDAREERARREEKLQKKSEPPPEEKPKN